MPGLPRAYLRVDPNIDQAYPELRGTFVGLLCAAARQPTRGWFRSRTVLEGLCGKAFVRRAFDRGDVSEKDGKVYVEGWDEWQEGDLTVRERMTRLRDRKRDKTVTWPSLDRTNASARVSPTPSSTPSFTEGGGPGEETTSPWLRAWLSVRGRMPTSKQQDLIDSYLSTFDETGSERAAQVFLENRGDPIGALLTDLRTFRAAARGEVVEEEAKAVVRRREERKGLRPGTLTYEIAQELASKVGAR